MPGEKTVPAMPDARIGAEHRIEVCDLRFSYEGKPVLKGIGFCADAGEVVAVLGPNGVGKTTLFSCLLGFRNKIFTGEIRICGEDVKQTPPALLAQRIAYVPQLHSPTFNYSVRDMVLMGTTVHLGRFAQPGDEQRARADAALEQVGITELAGRGYTQISGGERQLTLIARALAQDAKILVMDEPTANLDFGNQIRILSRIHTLTQNGYTIIQSTHNPTHARRFSDRVVALKDGLVAATGVPEQVLTSELICMLYDLSAEEYDKFAT